MEEEHSSKEPNTSTKPLCVIGYITMTFDTPHEGHHHVLKAAYNLCDKLIVGLTTDKTAIGQKRPTLQSWETRKKLLEESKYVSIVLPHNGEKKSKAWRYLQFHKCFTCAEEYFDSAEFDELRENCPQVQIIGIPRYPNQSSTCILNKMKCQFLKNTKVITTGITGPIFREGNIVWKTIAFGPKDLEHKSKDNYGFFQFDSLPRNYKHLVESQKNPVVERQEPSFPFISGINPGREIWLNYHLKDKPWSLFEFFSDEPTYPNFLTTTTKAEEPKTQNKTLEEFATYIKWERKFPKHVSLLVMRFGGQTLRSLLEQPNLDVGFLCDIIRKILIIIEELRVEGILHGDIHANNVIVRKMEDNASYDVFVIDWGWSSAHFFQLCKRERAWLSERLDENWDAQHFLGSLLNSFPTFANIISQYKL